MLLDSYTRMISKPACNSHFQSLHCIVRLDEDIAAVLPYLSALLGGSFIKDPPSVSLSVHGRLIGVHPDHIAINALRDEEEAERVIVWIRDQINEAWTNRDSIAPDTATNRRERAAVLEILRLLPKTNCRRCGHPTCTVFALQAAEGIRTAEDCLSIDPPNREMLDSYLSQFNL